MTDATYVTTKRLPWRLLAVPGMLVAIYTMLSYLAFADQEFFFESMEIAEPSNTFMIWSWGGKNTAMVAVLIAALITRLRVVVVIAMAMLLVGQIGDINAGVQSGTNVFITFIALALVAIEAILLWLDWRNEDNQMAPT